MISNKMENGELPKIVYSLSLEEEAGNVLNLLNDLIHEGYQYKDIAILFRVNSQTAMVEMFLDHEKIPFVKIGGRSFFESKECKDIIKYLKAFYRPHKISAKNLSSLFNRPTRYVTTATSNTFLEFAENYDNSISALADISQSFLSHAEIAKLDKFHDQIMLGAEYVKESPLKAVEYVLETIGYSKWAEENLYGKSTEVDVTLSFEIFKAMVSKHKTIDSFLNFVKEDLNKDREESKTSKKLKIMSVHASKGLEFPAVIVLGYCSRLYPFYRSVAEGNEAEERRISYVAMTRPEKKLYVSAIDGYLGRIKVYPSKYISDMIAEKIQ
jgi:DNA helicase-2/ATP-dependent DNA helicase PcrA